MLYHIYLISLPITFIVCLYAYKQLAGNFKWFLPYFAFVIVYELANFFDWLMIKHSNAWCNNLEGMIEFVLFTNFISSLDNRASYKKKVHILVAVIILLSFIDIFFIQGFWKRATIAVVLQSLFILVLICNYYYNLLEEAAEHMVLLKHPPFLVTTGLLFYFLSNTFYYSCFSYMVYKNNYHFYILAGSISNLLLNSLLIYAFLCFSKTKRLSVMSGGYLIKNRLKE
jgi:hypothetical protein